MKLNLFLTFIYTFILVNSSFSKKPIENVEEIYQKAKNFLSIKTKLNEDDDKNLTFEEIVTRKGYPLSSYHVTTEDGYILKLFRISGKKNSQNEKNNKSKKVVLLQHGLFVIF